MQPSLDHLQWKQYCEPRMGVCVHLWRRVPASFQYLCTPFELHALLHAQNSANCADAGWSAVLGCATAVPCETAAEAGAGTVSAHFAGIGAATSATFLMEVLCSVLALLLFCKVSSNAASRHCQRAVRTTVSACFPKARTWTRPAAKKFERKHSLDVARSEASNAVEISNNLSASG